MKSLQIANNLLLVTLFALFQKLVTRSIAPMDHKNRPGNCLKQGKRVRQRLFIQRKLFSFVKTFNALATHEKKEVYSQIPWFIIYLIFLNLRDWNGNLKHTSLSPPVYFPSPLTSLPFTLCLLFSKYYNEPLVTLPLHYTF